MSLPVKKHKKYDYKNMFSVQTGAEPWATSAINSFVAYTSGQY